MAVWSDRISESCTLTEPEDPNRAEAAVANLFGGKPGPSIDSLLALERHLDHQEAARQDDAAPFGAFHNGTTTLGRLCYLACRHARPQVVIETGVAYGVTSSYVLQALTENKQGVLHSIDLPPLAREAKQQVGRFVPQELRGPWRLEIGSAKVLLPKIVKRSGKIDMFVHDSLHTYAHMSWEFEVALSALKPGGVVVADDIEGNRAFEEFVQRPEIQSWSVLRQEGKNALCGIAVTKSNL
jgi:predicted O-methyltransferase YrrM